MVFPIPQSLPSRPICHPESEKPFQHETAVKAFDMIQASQEKKGIEDLKRELASRKNVEYALQILAAKPGIRPICHPESEKPFQHYTLFF